MLERLFTNHSELHLKITDATHVHQKPQDVHTCYDGMLARSAEIATTNLNCHRQRQYTELKVFLEATVELLKQISK